MTSVGPSAVQEQLQDACLRVSKVIRHAVEIFSRKKIMPTEEGEVMISECPEPSADGEIMIRECPRGPREPTPEDFKQYGPPMNISLLCKEEPDDADKDAY